MAQDIGDLRKSYDGNVEKSSKNIEELKSQLEKLQKLFSKEKDECASLRSASIYNAMT
jgi:hypothetical protein